MKKIISFILCAALLAGTLCAAADTSVPEIDSERYGIITNELTAVGVLEQGFSKTASDPITYSEFVGYISNLTGIAAEKTAEMCGVSSKILNEVVSYENAIKIAVNLLGWEYEAHKNGYASAAASLGLTDGVLNPNESFSRYDALAVIRNSLTADYLEQISFGDKNKYSSKGSTLLGRYKDIYEFSGILQANKWSTVYSEKGLEEDKIVVNDNELGITEFDYFGTDAMDLLGAEVCGFYKKDGAVKAALCIRSNSDVLVLTDKNDPKYNKSDRTIRYVSDNGSEKKISVPLEVNLVLNGKSYNDLSIINDEAFAQLDTIKAYKSSGRYISLHYSMYTSAVVDSAGKKSSVLGFADGTSLSLEAEDFNENVFLYDGSGKQIRFGDIQPGNVVSVYRSLTDEDGKTLIRIYAYDNSFFGKVMASENKDGKTLVTVSSYSVSEVKDDNGDTSEETVYDSPEEYEYCVGSVVNLEVGSCYKIYLDRYNRIVYAELQKGVGRLTGLYIKIAPVNEKLSSKKYQIFMMPDLDSSVASPADVFDLSDNVVIDYEKNGVRETVKLKNAGYEAIDEINRTLMHTAMYYKLNKNGEVLKIIGCSSTEKKGYLYNFNPEGIKLGTHNIVNDSFDVSKYYSGNASNYGGSNDIDGKPVEEGNADTYYGKNHIKYGDLAKSMILLPLISSPDEVDYSSRDKYYKRVNAADYGYVVNHTFAYFNGFSHDGAMLPSYGTIAYNPYEFSSSLQYIMPMQTKIFLINSVSWVVNEDGRRVMKLGGTFSGTEATLFTADDKIIDVSESTQSHTQYLSEISEGDAVFCIRDGNGDVTMMYKMVDYDPETKNVVLPKCTNVFRIYKDDLTGNMINETYNENDGITNINYLATRRVSMLLYPYKTAKQAYNNSLLSISYVADDDALRNAASPLSNPEQYEYVFSGTGTALYFDTSLDVPKNRVGKANMLNVPSYYDDPDSLYKTFVYTRYNEMVCTIVYKK